MSRFWDKYWGTLAHWIWPSLWEASPNYNLQAKSNLRSHFIQLQRYFVYNKKILFSRNICRFGGMQFISKKSQYVRCPGTELVCSGLCGHWEENLGGPPLEQSFNKCIHSTTTFLRFSGQPVSSAISHLCQLLCCSEYRINVWHWVFLCVLCKLKLFG